MTPLSPAATQRWCCCGSTAASLWFPSRHWRTRARIGLPTCWSPSPTTTPGSCRASSRRRITCWAPTADAALRAARSANFETEAFGASTDTADICATQALHAPVVVTLLDQVRSAIDRAHPRPPMLFTMDELADVASLPDLAATATEGGSEGLVG